MGIPKFFRFMSERYPLISQLIQENKIPEFDNLYLDMNGIIHNCSHPDDTNASFRITEEAIFLAVFAYISHLFTVIKPQKLFFLAVDGVAPRAKMNQQRSRRFRTAKEMKEIVDKARSKGEEIPEGEGFDSNCITPGTPFMVRLSEQLKYFIAKKVSEDADWRNVEIVLSGHEVPGEGEHKIMEYIRLKKAQPNYDPNVRHCLYGLDADLIMLGLLSHDPHFCLLREEVNFGPKRGKAKGLETQNFFLLHLSLFREYLDLEFSSLKSAVPALPFEYDLERIIDDFILLNIFVGNDFLPHLPGLHINEGALGRLFEIYKRILPAAGGYLNEHGVLHVKRLQLVLNELTVFETEHFEHEFADSNWFKGKQTKHIDAMETARARNKLVLTKTQRELFVSIQSFLLENLSQLSPNARLEIPATLPARDRRFLADIADELHLAATYDEFDRDGNSLIVLSFDETMMNLVAEEELEDSNGGETNGPEWKDAIKRVVAKYEKAPVAKDFDESDYEDSHAKQLEEQMAAWKKEYYREKLEFDYSDKESLHNLAYRYIEGLQWVLHYYYSGVASWGWFYNYHYAPKISDLQYASTYEFNFQLGTPFHPFEQLMGVLPDLSSAHIPLAFRDLMSDASSPILDFYPVNFETDLNGKKQDWEAIVKIPFIDEKRLLKTMAIREPRLTPEERARNTFGDSWRFTFQENLDFNYKSSLPGMFPNLLHCHCKLEPFHLPTLTNGLHLVKGLVPGVLLGKDAISGFPSLHTIPYTGQLGYHGVSVFQGDSRQETMVLSLEHLYEGLKSEQIAKMLVGNKTFTGYPYLQEALVVAVSDELFRYEIEEYNGQKRVKSTPHPPQTIMGWKRASERLEHVYSKRFGCLIGPVEVIVHARALKGLKRLDDGATIKEFEDREQEFALQATVQSVSSEDVRYMERPAIPVEIDFPIGSKVFFLQAVAYGVPAQVLGHQGKTLAIRIVFFPSDKAENLAFRQRLLTIPKANYVPSHAVAREVRMSGLALSKLTSSLMIAHGGSKTNIGLNLKFEAKAQKVLGYSQKGESGWEFSQQAIKLIQDYNRAFPEVAAALDTRRGDLGQATDFFDSSAVDARVKQLKAWLIEKGVRDFDKVPLYSEQLEKDTVMTFEKLADKIVASKVQTDLKVVAIENIPRQALLKPVHASNRLLDQKFSLGDRVAMVSDSGSVPMSAKGVVVGIQTGFIDVVFDVQFIGGTTLGDRCSPYRGQTVTPNSILNLSNPQFTAGAKGAAPPQPHTNGQTNGNVRGGPLFRRGPAGGPAILPAHGLPASGFRPAPPGGGNRPFANGHVQVLHNPSRPTPNGAPAHVRAPPPHAPLTHQQNLGAALGIPVNQSANAPPRAGPPPRGGSFPHRGGAPANFNAHGMGRGGMLSIPAQPAFHRGVDTHHAVYTPAQRGGFANTTGAPRGMVSLGRGGYAIPPPPQLTNGAPALRGRGRGRGAMRGAGAGRGVAEGQTVGL